MIRKLAVFAALILTALPAAFAQTTAPLPATSSAHASAPMKIGGDVLPPVLISSVEPVFPHSRFHKQRSSRVLVGLIVPFDGVPANVHVVKSGGSAFDKNAVAAVNHYRFKSASLHGQPVPVELTIEVQFESF